MSEATSSPNSLDTISKDISIPEETPAEVIIPSSTILLLVITVIDLLIDFKASIAPQCVVALFPSNNPALPSKSEPLQTDVIVADLSDIDFGDCDMVLGVAWNGNQCE